MIKVIENSLDISICGEAMTLLRQKAVYFKKLNAIIITDLHFAKAGHFRNAGIPVPVEAALADLENLNLLLNEFNPEKLIILGDLFHAGENFDMRYFEEWRNENDNLRIILVKGNHDILKDIYYDQLGIEIHSNKLELDNLILKHNYSYSDSYKYQLVGHVHPAVRVYGRGRQGLTLPCFCFKENYGILPAFGSFTGRHVINPDENDKIFVITHS